MTLAGAPYRTSATNPSPGARQVTLFPVVGRTVSTVSLLFELLQVISSAGLFLVIEKFIRSSEAPKA